MITWMQKHKKWLIVTIWVSAIAFIGAGMVNWGSYGFGSSNDKVARVGDIDIHLAEFQREYARILNEFSQISQFGGMLDEAQAKQFGIPQMALQRLIQQVQILNLANDLGLVVSDKEVGEEIVNAKVYVDDKGEFSQEVYRKALKEQGMSPSEFEEMVRKILTTQKLFSVMNITQVGPMLPISSSEMAALEMANAVRDRLRVEILPMDKVNIEIKDDELKAFWEKNAENWKSPMEFKVEYILVPFASQNPTDEDLTKHYQDFKSDYLDENGNLLSFEESKEKLIKDVQKIQAESVAKREYRDLKNKSKKGEILSLKENERFFVKNGVDLVIEDMKVAQVGQVLKPIEVDKGFVTLRFLDKKPSVQKSFEEAKAEAKVLFESSKKREKLLALAKERVKNFQGTDIGFVDRFYNGAILTLDDRQKMSFLSHLFSSKQKEGYVMLEDKAVLYRIVEQSVLNAKQGDAMAFKSMKSEAVLDALAEYLNETYKTTIYIDVSK
ncbi:peptidylprolyl isomerase [Helicobacter cinaedi]|uniref:peptidylprolyl isomerase n=2 Tax=Helicobacter cinaedi TaxID=213 RepID=UPI000D7CD5E9|nr:peptidylprolyl isomerase [Helicobacter cinaedi]BBB20712.1 peptidyl-prolyl cis-trans isomerase PpiD [Helicobacter cinaedi]